MQEQYGPPNTSTKSNKMHLLYFHDAFYSQYFQASLPEEPISRSFVELIVNKTNNHGLSSVIGLICRFQQRRNARKNCY